MSLCDLCYAPGACCKRFNLSTKSDHPVTLWDEVPLADQMAERKMDYFRPVEKIGGPWRDDETGHEYSTWLFSCDRLGDDGRCTAYEDRPAVCREYAPGSDALCVHWRGAEGVDLVEGL